MNNRIPDSYSAWDTRFRQYVNAGCPEQAFDAWSRMMTYAEPGARVPTPSALASRDRYLRGAYAISTEKSLTLLTKHYSGKLTAERKHMRHDLVARMLADAHRSEDTVLLRKVEQHAYTAPERLLRNVQKETRVRATSFFGKIRKAYTEVKEIVNRVTNNSWYQTIQQGIARSI